MAGAFPQMTRFCVAVAIVATSALSSAQAVGDAGAWRVPFRAPVIGLPLTAYSLQRGLAELAWSTRTPIGFEALSDEPWDVGPSASELDTAGRSVGDILNDILTREPRYGIANDEGVIHLRPRAAVADASNVLNQPIARFEMTNVSLTHTLTEVRFAVQPELQRGGSMGGSMVPSALGARRFSVRIQATSLRGVLDAIVKAHGAASWSVTYRLDNGQLLAQVSFHTFDGWSITG